MGLVVQPPALSCVAVQVSQTPGPTDNDGPLPTPWEQGCQIMQRFRNNGQDFRLLYIFELKVLLGFFAAFLFNFLQPHKDVRYM